MRCPVVVQNTVAESITAAAWLLALPFREEAITRTKRPTMRQVDHPRILLGSKIDDAVLGFFSAHEVLEPDHKLRI